ncbi:hypothetical protein CP967_22025 [Streptomyces nitrosporeus]|uniref:Peptidase n=2 Tax=Streptomyces nitrosporeus TaxID=28894 RepID=A0A5J6FE31_9ACTN|nr:hypothetical protein [Streptomyces nitrosporeus]QEU74316.1 hypothetical protein CP967_22025 [Streptomyces nitrosporeus]GGY96508.1 hypothetical protein GCM10010327_28800 [Streptomyces nitrosporeus]
MPTKPPARLRDGRVLIRLGLAAGLVVPAGLLGTPAPAAVPAAAPSASVSGAPDAVPAGARPVCGDPEAGEFPIGTRIHGGPDTYASGGGYGTWYLDLTNTTSRTCHAIHPVLVLTDEGRELTPEQIQLEFVERTHPDEEHRVSWESTDRDEQIGVFGGEEDDDFPGFTVPAERTVTVEVRMAFTSDTRPGTVTANAAVVQRRAARDGQGQEPGEADGDWVGESADYTFTIVEGAIDGGTDSLGAGNDGGTDDGGTDDDGTGNDGAGDEGTDGDGTGTTGALDREGAGARRGTAQGDGLPELARTGRAPAAWTVPVAGALVSAGAAALFHARSLRRRSR